ncbi:Galactose-3-O-sulfotransferase 3 [Mizuhopecten yessoensis]|uniref:Galactose-3-O-sulfotransferase 3 n=1 Tax=Mizuhopecten yessoensis TaxID=6573 RepID=A0A210Q6Q6_MIZYE|nr:Galactose-3-O-sulfotransferase 3 [Mizuhopecten yessoensis]
MVAIMRYRFKWTLVTGLCCLTTWVLYCNQIAYVNTLNTTMPKLTKRRIAIGQTEPTNHIRYSVKGDPVQHIAFIKVHKAASTTIENIFLRYGYEHDLTFALPRKKDRGGIKLLKKQNIIPIPNNKHIDIFCTHVRFDRDDFSSMLPNDTVHIGIVREPFSQFESSIRFLRQKAVIDIPGKNPVYEYLAHNDKHMKTGGDRIPTTYNFMSYDFGFPIDLFWKTDYNAMQDYLLQLNEDFDIVLVMEFLDESIVLMRRVLNWDLRYVLYGKLNAKKNIDPRLKFGPNEEKLYQNWAKLDYALYYFFLQKHKERIRNQPPDFFEELAYFRETRTKYDNFCSALMSDDKNTAKLSFEGSAWNKPFVVTREHCEKLYIHDVTFINILKRRHLQLLNE